MTSGTGMPTPTSALYAWKAFLLGVRYAAVIISDNVDGARVRASGFGAEYANANGLRGAIDICEKTAGALESEAKDLPEVGPMAIMKHVHAEMRLSAEGAAQQQPVFVLKSTDALSLPTIEAYRRECVRRRLDDQARQVTAAFLEMAAWQARNPELIKLPDHKHVPVE